MVPVSRPAHTLLEQRQRCVGRIGRVEHRGGREFSHVLAVADGLATLDRGAVVAAVRIGKGKPQRPREIGVGAAREAVAGVLIAVDDEAVDRERRDPDVALGEEQKFPAALAGVELMGIHQPGQDVARRHQRVGRVAEHQRRGAHQGGGIVGRDRNGGTEFGDDPLQRHLAEAPGQPMAEFVVRRIVPDRRAAGKSGNGRASQAQANMLSVVSIGPP